MLFGNMMVGDIVHFPLDEFGLGSSIGVDWLFLGLSDILEVKSCSSVLIQLLSSIHVLACI